MYANLPLMHAGLGLVRLVRGLRDAEVDHLHRALPRDQDVVGADVAVNQVQRLARLGSVQLVREGQALARPRRSSARTARNGSGPLQLVRALALSTRRFGPSMYSIARKYSPSAWPKSKICTMFGWLSCGGEPAPRRGTSRRSCGSSARCGRMRLTHQRLLEAAGACGLARGTPRPCRPWRAS